MVQENDLITADSALKKIADNKALLKAYFQTAFINFDPVATKPLITEEYIQHNPVVPSGAEPFLGLLAVLKEGGMDFHNHRIIADEEFVVSHNLVKNVPIPGYGDVVTFDVWRVEDGKLAEHWDNVTELAATPNPAGRTQVDGTTEIVDFEKTAANKAFILDFIDTVLVGGDFSKLADYISEDTYIQHNTQMGDGIAGLKAGLKDMADAGISMKYDQNKFIVGEGNFVFTMSEGSLAGKHTSFYDLFRIADGKIVEHWDVIESIPEEWAHGNGKF